MRVLGIDPGVATIGFGVVECDRVRSQLVQYGVITTPAGLPLSRRLLQISEDMQELITTFKPDEAAVEELFFSKNITTGISVAHGRGVLLLELERAGVPVFEYTPLQVKQAVVGYGKADKNQVQQMTKAILGLEKIPKDRPVLFTPNHQSYADVPILLHALKDFDFGFLMRMQLNKLFAIEQISHILHCVPINQENAREGIKALNKTAEQIKDGLSMVVFPEGKRGFSNTPDEFKNGAFKIVQKTGVTVVPIYIPGRSLTASRPSKI